jgi:Rrf2 family protein
MNLGQTEDYAVRALVDLASHPEARIREMAERTDIPSAHLAKVIQSLARAGLVETTRGRHGGVRLARPPEEITLKEIVEAMQGPLRFIRCPRRGEGCPRDPECGIYRLWTGMQEGIASMLERVRLADVAPGLRCLR